ncbi:uncharacterized protein LOC132387609, partial [Hypanus sabinus]|uniref:uncharacterized protein LOC132387609 n=1 Tax=Hypanus sabinus TaxID=79690 RepID=UPI0028C509B4
SGKTTLLSILSGRLHPSSGSVTLGGRPLDKSARRQIGYVTQEDLFFGNLTLRDTLMYQAHLRLPRTTKTRDKEKVVLALAEELNITKCLNT